MTRHPAPAIALSVFVVLLSAACRRAPQAPPELPEPPSIVAEMPTGVTVADPGHPGDWVPLEGVSPAARAFVVGPSGQGPAPGILLVHGTWGLNRDVRLLARQLAERGAVVCAPDLYDGVFAGSRPGAAELVESVSVDRAQRSMAAARARLEADPRVGGRPVVLLALGQGARWALPAASAAGGGLSRVVLDNPPVTLLQVPPALEPPVLIFAGALSSAYDDRSRASLDEAFRAAGVTLTWEVIPAAGTDLLDPRAMGFSRAAYDVVVGKVAGMARSAG